MNNRVTVMDGVRIGLGIAIAWMLLIPVFLVVLYAVVLGIARSGAA